MAANVEDDPSHPENVRQYWLGRRHELKYIMEQLGMEVPELKLGGEVEDDK